MSSINRIQFSCWNRSCGQTANANIRSHADWVSSATIKNGENEEMRVWQEFEKMNESLLLRRRRLSFNHRDRNNTTRHISRNDLYGFRSGAPSPVTEVRSTTFRGTDLYDHSFRARISTSSSSSGERTRTSGPRVTRCWNKKWPKFSKSYPKFVVTAVFICQLMFSK